MKVAVAAAAVMAAAAVAVGLAWLAPAFAVAGFMVGQQAAAPEPVPA